MTRTNLTLAAALALAGLPVLAQDAPAVADPNGDGLYTMEELMVAVPDLTAEVYTAIDTNADGGIDETELTAAIAAGTITPAG